MTTARLTEFGFLGITGIDAVKFLQGYTTCDLEPLQPGDHAYGAICNLQGRMITNFRVARTADGLVLRLNAALVAATRDFLAKYIVFSKATLRDLSQDLVCLGCTGDDFAGATVRIELGEGRSECWLPASAAADGTSGDTGVDDWHDADIRAGIAWITPATTGEFLPQSLALHVRGGIDFDKGCYLGQEIVARLQYRGELKQRLYLGTGGCVATGNPETAIGGAVTTAGGEHVGTVVAASTRHCLAVLRAADYTDPLDLPGGDRATFVAVA